MTEITRKPVINRFYKLDFAFEGMGIHKEYDVNIVGECVAEMWDERITHLKGKAFLSDEDGVNVQSLDIKDCRDMIWNAIFNDKFSSKITYDENTYQEEEYDR